MADVNLFNLSRARTLVDDPNSCITRVTATEKIKLPLSYVRNVKKGIRDSLNSQIKRCSERLDGVILAYEKVVVGSRSVECTATEPALMFNIKAVFLVFNPHVGSILTGIVNKIGRDHIGCLVHESFNVALSKRDLTPNDAIQLGSQVLFEVTFVDLQSKMIFMRGLFKSLVNGPGAAEASMELEETSNDVDELSNSVPSSFTVNGTVNSAATEEESSSSSNDEKLIVSLDLCDASTPLNQKHKRHSKQKKPKKTADALSKTNLSKSDRKRKRSIDDGDDADDVASEEILKIIRQTEAIANRKSKRSKTEANGVNGSSSSCGTRKKREKHKKQKKEAKVEKEAAKKHKRKLKLINGKKDKKESKHKKGHKKSKKL